MTLQERSSPSNNIKFAEYQKTKEHYLSNAKETIQKKEFRKASELLWGVVTQEIKAIAILKGFTLSSHGEMEKFIKRIVYETGDKRIFDLFSQMEFLHKNFYDKKIEDKHFNSYYSQVFEFLGRMEKLRS
ncbi:MAG: hypothetical protein HY520_03010 [Candidatus Aenigmarchaeota archaeon]|nr:hypothetical protein [Candidatus Aenigmarchaeota archaeon]